MRANNVDGWLEKLGMRSGLEDGMAWSYGADILICVGGAMDGNSASDGWGRFWGRCEYAVCVMEGNGTFFMECMGCGWGWGGYDWLDGCGGHGVWSHCDGWYVFCDMLWNGISVSGGGQMNLGGGGGGGGATVLLSFFFCF